MQNVNFIFIIILVHSRSQRVYKFIIDLEIRHTTCFIISRYLYQEDLITICSELI